MRTYKLVFKLMLLSLGLGLFTGCYQSPSSIFKKRSTDYFNMEQVCPLKVLPHQRLVHYPNYDIPRVKKTTPLTDTDLLPPGICF